MQPKLTSTSHDSLLTSPDTIMKYIIFSFALALCVAGCDAVVDQTESLPDEVQEAISLPPEGEIAMDPWAGTEQQASKTGNSSRFSMWSGTRTVSAGRHFKLYGRRGVFSPGYSFEFEVDTYSGDPNLYLVTWDSDGQLRRVIRASRNSPGRDESVPFSPDDLQSQDAYAGVLVFASSDQSARFKLTLWAQRDEEEGLSLRYPLDRQRAIIGGYEYGDHWLNMYCVEAGLQTKRLLHAGVDYYAPNFGEKVYAAASGRIRYARSDATWGGYIVVEHTAQDGSKFTTTYTHVAPTVSSGDTVTDRTQVGTIASGSAGYGAHLDFRVRMRPYSSDDLIWILRGRFPETSCIAVAGGPREPSFPEHTIDPETINWIPR